MAATLQIATFGRAPVVFGDLAGIYVTINANGATYATGTGGLPIDLTGILQQAAPAGWDAPYGIQALNPADVIGITPIQLSTNKFLPMNLVIGTPTYTSVPWQSGYNAASPALPSGNDSATPGFLATCPATVRLYGTGAGNAAAFAEVADGANTDVFTCILLVARNGANN